MSAREPLHRTRKIGRFTVHAIQAGGLKLDGGAMFGIVPKPLWERRIQADERNRIQLGMRCLLVEHDVGLVLIDNGAGNKEDDKFHEIYAVENEGEWTTRSVTTGCSQIRSRLRICTTHAAWSSASWRRRPPSPAR